MAMLGEGGVALWARGLLLPALQGSKVQVLTRVFWLSLQVAAAAVTLEWLRQVAKLRLRLWGCAGGPWPWPVLGTLPRLVWPGLNNLHRTSFKDWQLFGNLYSWTYFNKDLVATSCPFHMRRVLVTHWREYDRSEIEQSSFGDFLGEGLILVANDKWSDMRRLYQSGFSDRNILAFSTTLRQLADSFAQQLVSDQSASRTVDMQDAVQRLTFRLIGLFALGVDFEDEAKLSALQQQMREGPWVCKNYGELWFRLLEHLQMRFIFGPFHWWRVIKTPHVRAFERGRALLLQEIEGAMSAGSAPEAEAPPGEGHGKFRSLRSFMVGEKGQRFTRQEMCHQALTFLFAGHDTTTNAIAWCLHLLAERPAMLARARAEAKSAAGPKPFLRCCLLETLRLYPSAPMRARSLRQRADTFTPAAPAACPMLRRADKVHLAPGSGLFFSIYNIHRNPEYWPRPEAFEPERFQAHVEKTLHTFLTGPRFAEEGEPITYFPFGAGPRRCIGENFALLEAEEVCSAVLRRWAIRCAPGPPPVDELHLTLRARDGIHLVLTEPSD